MRLCKSCENFIRIAHVHFALWPMWGPLCTSRRLKKLAGFVLYLISFLLVGVVLTNLYRSALSICVSAILVALQNFGLNYDALPTRTSLVLFASANFVCWSYFCSDVSISIATFIPSLLTLIYWLRKLLDKNIYPSIDICGILLE